jgi:hypothetical protein
MKEPSIENAWRPCVRFKSWSSCVELKGSHAMAYVLISGGSVSWEYGYKKKIQVVALCQGHDGIMSWAKID